MWWISEEILPKIHNLLIGTAVSIPAHTINVPLNGIRVALNEFECIICNRFADAPAAWLQLFKEQDSGAASAGILKSLDESGLSHLQFFYILVIRKNKPAAAFYLQVLKVLPVHFPDFSSVSFTARTLYQAISCSRYHLAVCGNLFYSGINGMVFNKGLSLADKQEIGKSVIKWFTSEYKISLFLAKDLAEEGAAVLKKIRTFQPFDLDQVMDMEISPDWQSINDYINALSKKYAARSRKLEQHISAFTIEQWDDKTMNLHWNQIEKLYQNIMDRSQVKLGVLNAEYFVKLKSMLKNDFHFMAWMLNGQLTGFSTYIRSGNQMELYYIGMDYQVNRSHHLYHCMLQKAVADAISLKVKLLHFGRTAVEAKTIAGARPVKYRHAYFVKGPLLKLAFGYALKYWSDHEIKNHASRNPFKS